MDIMRHLSGRLCVLTGDYREACETLAGMKPDEPRQPENLLARIRRFASAFAAGRDEAEALKHAALRAASAERDENTQAAADALSAGDVLFREGDEGRCMYRLLRGEMGIYSGYGTPEQKRLTTILPKSYFGEMGLIDHAPRSATAAAMKKGTKVEAIYEEDLAKIFREKPDEIHEMLRQLVFRLRRLTADYLEVCRLIAVMERAESERVSDTDREKAERMAKAWQSGNSDRTDVGEDFC